MSTRALAMLALISALACAVHVSDKDKELHVHKKSTPPKKVASAKEHTSTHKKSVATYDEAKDAEELATGEQESKKEKEEAKESVATYDEAKDEEKEVRDDKKESKKDKKKGKTDSKKDASHWGGNDKKEEKMPDGCNERFLLPCGWGFYGRGTACMSGDKHICCEAAECPEAAKEDPEPEPTTPAPHEEPEIPAGVSCDAKPYKVDIQGKCHAKDGKYAKSECCADQKCYMLCKKMFGKCDFYPPLEYKGGEFDCSVCNECA